MTSQFAGIDVGKDSLTGNRFAVIALNVGSAVRQAKRCGNLPVYRYQDHLLAFSTAKREISLTALAMTKD